MVEAPTIVDDMGATIQARRRERSLMVGNEEQQVVEWWKPGWQRKLR
jgi:hypothetical protein